MGNPRYISDVESNPFVFPKNLVPNNGGANLKKIPAELIIKMTPKNEKPIYKIEFPNPDDNLKEVKVTLFPVDKSKEPEVIPATDANQPIYPSYTEPVNKIKIEIISTTDNKNPKNVEISVQSCSPESSTPIIPLTTTNDIFSTFTGYILFIIKR